MNTLSTYLWKEWREQRATLAALALLLALGIAAVIGALPRTLANDPLVFQGAVAIAVLAAIMSTGSDLLAREHGGAALRFLERMPAGLQTAFRAKLVFFAGTLACAAAYGALAATAAGLLRCGSLPHGLLEGQAPWWIALLLGTSTWVFAASAWMPASALTFPGTLLLLAVLAWRWLLAMSGDRLYELTPLQDLAFALLCVAGAPLSAWSAFVIGLRRGRSRGWAAGAGLGVAALCFAPTWAWAASRYAGFVNAPFEILHGTTGLNGRYAFLVLTRRVPPGVAPEASDRWDRPTALLVDVERGTWSFSGPVDASAFLSASSASGRMHLPEDELAEPVSLVSSRSESSDAQSGVLFDRETAERLEPNDPRAESVPRIGPREFGLATDPQRYMIRSAGAGHRLHFRREGGFVDLYRDPDGRVFEASALPRGAYGAELYDVRVRRGRWIARDARAWVQLDPRTGELGPLDCVQADEWLGPMLDDGRVLVVRDARPEVLDTDSGQRTTLALVGDQGFELRSLADASGMSAAALPAATPSVVYVSGNGEMRLAVLDLARSTLDLGPANGGRLVRLLGVDPLQPLAIEDGERIVRYDLLRDEREVLFTIDQVH